MRYGWPPRKVSGIEVSEETVCGVNLLLSSSGMFRGTRVAKTVVRWRTSPSTSSAIYSSVCCNEVGGPTSCVVNTKEIAPREFYTKRNDVEALGHTKDFPGCRTMFLGGTRQAHTLECRERLRYLMKDEDKDLWTREKRKKVRGEDGGGDKECWRRRSNGRRRKKAEKRGKKREAEGDMMEEKSPVEMRRRMKPEEKREKPKVMKWSWKDRERRNRAATHGD